MLSTKPLPDVPRSPSGELSLDSRDHLRKLLDLCLAHESDALKPWASAIETALYEAVDAIRDGDWLSGIKLAKVNRRKKSHPPASTMSSDRAKGKEKPKRDANGEKTGDEGSEVEARNNGRVGKERSGSNGSNSAETGSFLSPLPAAANRRNAVALQQLRDLVSSRQPVSPLSAKHLLLTVAHPNDSKVSPYHSPVSSHASRTCTFRSREFALPKPDLFGEDPAGNADLANSVSLCGFKEWETDSDLRLGTMELVGGTFSFSPRPIPEEYDALTRVLRAAVFTVLSLLLEQSFLADVNIELQFPALEPQEHSNRRASLDRDPSTSSQHYSPETRHRFRDSFLSSSIFGAFSRKTTGLFHRHLSFMPHTASVRGGSLDLPTSAEVTQPPPTPVDDPSPRQRRISFFGQHRKTLSTQTSQPEEPLFHAVLRQLEISKDVLSTSPDVTLPPPVLLSRLVEKETVNPAWRLLGEERTALSSIFGWEGRKTRGAGMTGVRGFLRQQRISVLYSEHILQQPDRRASAASDITMKASLNQNSKARVQCGPRARLRTYDYYAFDQDNDRPLGDVIIQACQSADEKCSQPNCPSLRGQHELHWLHKDLRIIGSVRKVKDPEQSEEHVYLWESCAECDAVSARRQMSNGTYLLSFAKYLELLFYSPRLRAPSRPLCSHTARPPQAANGTPLPRSYLNTVRHFAFKSHALSFTLSHVRNIFEFRLPRLQLSRPPDRIPSSSISVEAARLDRESSEEKTSQQKEIRAWWQSIADHLDKLEAQFDDNPSSINRKTLPRLPSTWDDSESSSRVSLTPKAGSASLLYSPSSPTLAPLRPPLPRASTIDAPRSQSVPSDISDTSPGNRSSKECSAEALSLLSKMRFTFQQVEHELYTQLQNVPETELNNVRRVFHTTALGALRRLAAWEAKHLSKSAKEELATNRRSIERPWWWGEMYHAVPDSNIIIKDDDWGSIIAFTLSSADYLHELDVLTHHRTTTASTSSSNLEQPPSLAAIPSKPYSPALSTASDSSFKLFSRPSQSKLDPDNDEAIWAELEAWSAVVTRKEHPRDPTAILSLREVLRYRAPIDATTGLPPSIMSSMSRIVGGNGNGDDNSSGSYARPAIELSKQVADGHVEGYAESGESVERLLRELDSASITSNSTANKASSATSSALVTADITRHKSSSVISRGSERSSNSVDSDKTAGPHIVPSPRDSGTEAASLPKPSASTYKSDQPTQEEYGSAFSWASSLSNVMRFVSRTTDQPTHPGLPPGRNGRHDLLAAQADQIDERPHVKYDWTIGKRLKYSCTVYYAKQFDLLRKQCGVEDVFLESMSHSSNWGADGGKSKSNFWKTSDDRFIIKTLVNAWNVADLQVLIELAPSYFRYMENTASRASVLVKLLGFYTIEIRNLETGSVQAKADLLVMENLFYAQSVSKTFDLKGIQGRKVKAAETPSSKTLFDSEWIEGQEKALMFVYPHSKDVLREALRCDCDFLAKSNIMDYSLLLGVNEADKQISCGLVDTIGSYTFAKTLEYKAKQGFSGKDSKDVTVMPPHEYQDRFIRALDGYFLACPDKWTKPENEKATYDHTDLPSVL